MKLPDVQPLSDEQLESVVGGAEIAVPLIIGVLWELAKLWLFPAKALLGRR